jgi:hypothetical protein
MAATVTLPCPICDRPYAFSRDGVSVCGACGHEVTSADPEADTPKIAPSRKYVAALRWVLLAAFGCMFVHALAGAVLIVITFLALAAAGNRRARCGNCGSGLQSANANSCPRCGASFTFSVD